MSQIKVICSQSAELPNVINVNFIPSSSHWGCVDLDDLLNELQTECNNMTYSVINESLLFNMGKKLQAILDQWQATKSLWVKDLH